MVSSKMIYLASLTIVSLAIVALMAAVILRGSAIGNAPSLSALAAFLGLLINALIGTVMLTRIEAKVNGHLAAHMDQVPGHSDEQLSALIDAGIRAVLRDLGVSNLPPQEPPAS